MGKCLIWCIVAAMLITLAGCDFRASRSLPKDNMENLVIHATDPVISIQKPPAGTLHTPEGDTPLCVGGYDWTRRLGNGREEATIADQSARPVEKSFLQPVAISSRYAETVYALAPEGNTYAPTNSLGYLVKLSWEIEPTAVSYTCWPEAVWENSGSPQESVVSQEGSAFYAKPGGYVYEITAQWKDTGAGCHGKANYYVYIIGGAEHTHQIAAEPQTVDDPVTGYCGNTQTTLYIGDKTYSFMYGCSVTLTDILVNLNYDPAKVCRCSPELTVDTEFGTGYGVDLTQGYARCPKGQADLTREQIDTITKIVQWAETTNCQYPLEY